jgi:hypothetical protein
MPLVAVVHLYLKTARLHDLFEYLQLHHLQMLRLRIQIFRDGAIAVQLLKISSMVHGERAA